MFELNAIWFVTGAGVGMLVSAVIMMMVAM